MVSAIVAVDMKNGIGNKGKLLAKIPNDMKHFKEITLGSSVIMGRKTWESLPHALEGRANYVITSNPPSYDEGCTFISMEEAIDMIQSCGEKNIFIIGGGQIYEELLPYCQALYMTKILTWFTADTFFKMNYNDWVLCNYSDVYKEDYFYYQFREYKRC